MHERTLAGLEAARARGREGGRPKPLDEDDALMALELHQSNKASVEAISKRFGVADDKTAIKLPNKIEGLSGYWREISIWEMAAEAERKTGCSHR